MIIKVKRTAKDRPLVADHKTYSRREFMERGIFTTTMAAALPHAIVASMAKSAFASSASCPVAAAAPGGLAQIHGPGGGFSIASYILTMNQLNMATTGSSAANLWGVTGGANLTQCFANAGVDATSPFGNALLTPPPGITATAWTKALKQCSWGFNFGTATADDGGGEQQGHIGSYSPIKKSVLNKDIAINANGVSLAPWATALGSSTDKVNTSSQKLTAASLAAGFGIAPSKGTSGSLFANTAAAGTALGNLFSSLLGGSRTGATTSLTAASCGFMGDSQMAASTFGTNLFTAANIPAIVSSGVTLASLTTEELAFLAAYYQSDIGQLGGITSVNPGADYHGQSVQNTIAPYDQNLGIQVRMWLLAAMIAQQPAAMILSTNGTPGPNGTQNVTINAVSGSATTTVAVNGNSAQGDDGGSFSGNGLLCYAPNSATPPTLAWTGTVLSDGKVKASPLIASVPSAIASHYFTALSYLNTLNGNAFNTTQFLAVLAANGVTAPVNLMDVANGS
jgi:hypothetical protein